MNKLFLILAAVLLMQTTAEAQTERRIYTQAEQAAMQNRSEESAAQEKALEKELQRMQDSINYVQAVRALEKLDFVVEADKLVFRHGESAFVNSTTNFVSLKDDQAVVQIAPFNGGGPNGVGGITLKGTASDIRVKTDRKGNTFFTMNVMGAALSAYVTFTLPKGTNYTSVTVEPTFNGNRITFYGKLLPAKHARTFEGRSL